MDDFRKVVGIIHFETEETVEKIYLPIVENVDEDIDINLPEDRCARVMLLANFIELKAQSEPEHEHKILHLLDKNDIDLKV